MPKYTLDDYSQIIFNGISYDMPDITKSIIKSLMAEIGNVTENMQHSNRDKISSSSYKRQDNRRPPPNFKKPDENWEKIKQFQATKIEKKEGVDKYINDIRICLNKISSKNYDTQCDAINKYIDQIVAEYANCEDKTEYCESMTKIAKSIFDIASTNKFYSDLYAKLYNDLLLKYTEFSENIDSVIQQYLDGVMLITFVDQNDDYDNYCENNKTNDKRKAMSAFIVNLMKYNIINADDVLSLIIKLQDTVLEYINLQDKSFIVDEITENIFIFVTMSLETLYTFDKWAKIIYNIKTCSQIKPKESPSMSSRAIFKYMDILDFIKKSKKL